MTMQLTTVICATYMTSISVSLTSGCFCNSLNNTQSSDHLRPQRSFINKIPVRLTSTLVTSAVAHPSILLECR